LPISPVFVTLAPPDHVYGIAVLPKKATPKSDSGTPNFEQAMQELEALVERMEKGDLTLEESLKDFERGVALTRICQSALRDAEQKVQMLTKQAGTETLVPFDEEDTGK